MAVKHPYIAATGAVAQIFNQFRKSFPAVVDATTLKKLSVAPNNESYLINTLKFIGLLDGEGKRLDQAKTLFVKHEDAEFSQGLSDLIKKGYSDLFELQGDDAWALPMDKLIAYFRQSDETSDVIGMRQARTFAVLAQYVGRREAGGAVPQKKAAATAKSTSPTKVAKTKSAPMRKAANTPVLPPSAPTGGVAALTVRIEVNLPAGADQDTYDAIFKSIRENLM